MGRDIGKLKKDGFLRGTHARRISFIGIFGVLGLSAVYTVYKVCFTDWDNHWVYRLITTMDESMDNHRNDVHAAQMRKKYAKASKEKSSDSPWDY